VVTGATGRQGGAVARHLLADGWHVRGVTRTPDSKASKELARLGAELVRADMADADRMRKVCEGAHGVFSVQNAMIGGEEGERAQGRNVVAAAPASPAPVSQPGTSSPRLLSTPVAAAFL
jgi:uncharacterized protein YbjT (DUF2867 family)